MSTKDLETSHSASQAQSISIEVEDRPSETSTSSPVLVSTPSVTSEPDKVSLRGDTTMDVQSEKADDQSNVGEGDESGKRGTTEQASASTKVTVKRRSDTDSSRKVKETVVSAPGSSASKSDSTSCSESEQLKRKEKKKAKRSRTEKAARTNDRFKMKSKQRAKADKRKSKKDRHDVDSYEEASSDDTASESDDDGHSGRHVRKYTRASRVKRRCKKRDSSSDELSSKSSSSSSPSSSGSSSTDSDADSESMKRKKRKMKHKERTKKLQSVASDDEILAAEDSAAIPVPMEPILPTDDIDTQVIKTAAIFRSLKLQQSVAKAAVAAAAKLEKPTKKKGLEFKRVDQVYDMKIHDWKLVESTKDQKDEFDCVFTVRRRLDWDGKYKETQVDIKSKLLRSALQEVFKECKSISLVEDTPQIDPHTLFHYYEELNTFTRKDLKSKLRKAKKSREKKQITRQIAQCKLLLSYIDEDYDATRKALRPMLKAGTITYDLVWALFKPNTITFTPTYGNKDDPRCFKADVTYEYESWMTGLKSWVVDGRYLEYDGKCFGLGDHQVSIQAFKGHKKITHLAAYPLKFHKDARVSIRHFLTITHKTNCDCVECQKATHRSRQEVRGSSRHELSLTERDCVHEAQEQYRTIQH